MNQNGQGSPWVTTTDGTNNAIVWVVGAQGDQRLHGYNGDTGAVVYAGGGANELMTGTRKWNSGIVARGSIYVANDNRVYAFRVPGRNAYPYTYSICVTHLLQLLQRRLTATATQLPRRLRRPRQSYSDAQLPQPPLQAVRHRHPDQRPLRDPMRHRGRGRVRRQGRRPARIIRKRMRRACRFPQRATRNLPSRSALPSAKTKMTMPLLCATVVLPLTIDKQSALL